MGPATVVEFANSQPSVAYGVSSACDRVVVQNIELPDNRRLQAVAVGIPDPPIPCPPSDSRFVEIPQWTEP